MKWFKISSVIRVKSYFLTILVMKRYIIWSRLCKFLSECMTHFFPTPFIPPQNELTNFGQSPKLQPPPPPTFFHSLTQKDKRWFFLFWGGPPPIWGFWGRQPRKIFACGSRPFCLGSQLCRSRKPDFTQHKIINQAKSKVTVEYGIPNDLSNWVNKEKNLLKMLLNLVG